jgi:hypothetical protein
MNKRLSFIPAVILALDFAQPAGVLPAPPNEPAQVEVAGDAVTIRYHGETIFEGKLKNREVLGRATVNAYRARPRDSARAALRRGSVAVGQPVAC